MLPPCWRVNGRRSSSSLLRNGFHSTGYGGRGEAPPSLSRPPAAYSHTPQVSKSEPMNTTNPRLVPSRESGEDDDDDEDGEQPPACLVWQWVSNGLETDLQRYSGCCQVPGWQNKPAWFPQSVHKINQY